MCSYQMSVPNVFLPSYSVCRSREKNQLGLDKGKIRNYGIHTHSTASKILILNSFLHTYSRTYLLPIACRIVHIHTSTLFS